MRRDFAMVAALTAVLWGGVAGAVDTTWIPGTSNNWNMAGNWNNGLPGPGTNVFIDGETGAASIVTLDTSPTIANLTISAGDTLQKDASANNRTLTVKDGFANSATIRHNQGTASFTLVLPASTLNTNSGTIRADGRGFSLQGAAETGGGYKLNNSGGVIEAINGGTLVFGSSGTVSNGSLNADSTSTISFARVNGGHNVASIAVNNAGTFQMLLASFAENLSFVASGGLTNWGTARLSLSGIATKATWTFDTGTTLNNAPGGTFTIENIRTDTVATSQSYLDLKTGSTLVNSGLIEIKSLTNTYGTAQLRSAINLTNAGTITVAGAASSIQMAGKTNTQTSGTLDIKNGGCVVATNVLINGGTLAGNGSITGNVTLASGVTRAWSYTNGVAGAMTIAGTLTLPATATVQVSGSGAVPNPATVFVATSLAGAGSISGWTVTGVNGYAARIDSNRVVLVKSAEGALLTIQ